MLALAANPVHVIAACSSTTGAHLQSLHHYWKEVRTACDRLVSSCILHEICSGRQRHIAQLHFTFSGEGSACRGTCFELLLGWLPGQC